ncbi:MAG: agmatine deiminase family protein [Planctomycetaceae bacterium]|nr:agmatine deiminase family protein [Planctomycetales bacterium]MCB9923202.1 agmatine deiminase family protein [Planctomycetaceae bacterium]
MSDITPRALGYRWPAEWERHLATWLSWPHNPDTWPGNFEVVPGRFAELVRTIAQFEPVNVLAGGESVLADATKHVGGQPNVQLFDITTNDAWCRDHGPLFLVGPDESALVDWEYNAWGGKYPPFDKDNAVPRQIALLRNCRRFAPGIILEGGSVEGNGLGTVLTTETCLLNPNRNAGLSRADTERYLGEYLSATNILWLPRGELAGDDTDGHIDQLARFVNPTTIVAAWEDDPTDVNHEPLRENFDQLSGMLDQDGNKFQIVKLPLPKPKFYEGHRLPACYCNFYMANGSVIVPQFDDPADQMAIQVLQDLCPDRTVVGVPSLDIVWGLGSFHCLTQQEPAR